MLTSGEGTSQMPPVLLGQGASLPRHRLPSAPGAADPLYGSLVWVSEPRFSSSLCRLLLL